MTTENLAGPNQAMAALERANDLSMRRAALKRRVRAADPEALFKLAELVDRPTWWMLTANLDDVLSWLPQVGPVARRKMMRRWGLVDAHKVTMEDLGVDSHLRRSVTSEVWRRAEQYQEAQAQEG